MKAVILAGGLGTRLHPFTKVIPKPLLPVGDRSVVEIQIAQLKKHGVDRIIFATNYKSDLLESYFGDGSKFGVSLRYSREETPLGTCGPLSLIRDELNDDFIVMNGDILTNIDFEKAFGFHQRHHGVLTVVSKDVTFPLSYGNIVTEDDRIISLEEKPDVRVEIVTGIYCMSPKVLDYIPANEPFGMDDCIQKLFALNVPVYRYKMSEYWLDIGRMEDYQKAQTVCDEQFSE